MEVDVKPRGGQREGEERVRGELELCGEMKMGSTRAVLGKVD